MRNNHVMFICGTILLIVAVHLTNPLLATVGAIILLRASMFIEREYKEDRLDAKHSRDLTGYYGGD